MEDAGSNGPSMTEPDDQDETGNKPQALYNTGERHHYKASLLLSSLAGQIELQDCRTEQRNGAGGHDEDAENKMSQDSDEPGLKSSESIDKKDMINGCQNIDHDFYPDEEGTSEGMLRAVIKVEEMEDDSEMLGGGAWDGGGGQQVVAKEEDDGFREIVEGQEGVAGASQDTFLIISSGMTDVEEHLGSDIAVSELIGDTLSGMKQEWSNTEDTLNTTTGSGVQQVPISKMGDSMKGKSSRRKSLPFRHRRTQSEDAQNVVSSGLSPMEEKSSLKKSSAKVRRVGILRRNNNKGEDSIASASAIKPVGSQSQSHKKDAPSMMPSMQTNQGLMLVQDPKTGLSTLQPSSSGGLVLIPTPSQGGNSTPTMAGAGGGTFMLVAPTQSDMLPKGASNSSNLFLIPSSKQQLLASGNQEKLAGGNQQPLVVGGNQLGIHQGSKNMMLIPTSQSTTTTTNTGELSQDVRSHAHPSSRQASAIASSQNNSSNLFLVPTPHPQPGAVCNQQVTSQASQKLVLIPVSQPTAPTKNGKKKAPTKNNEQLVLVSKTAALGRNNTTPTPGADTKKKGSQFLMQTTTKNGVVQRVLMPIPDQLGPGSDMNMCPTLVSMLTAGKEAPLPCTNSGKTDETNIKKGEANTDPAVQTDPNSKETADAPTVQAREPDLPKGLSYRYSSVEGKRGRIVGVWCREDIRRKRLFGPYKGALVDEEEGCPSESTWELCMRGKVFFYIDGKKAGGEWMAYVQGARSTKEQNLEAVQRSGDIYFRATKTIRPGDALRVFYSKGYAQSVGFDITLPDLQYESGRRVFLCGSCQAPFPTAKLTVRHVKLSHGAKRVNELRPVLAWRMCKQSAKDDDPTEKALLDLSKAIQERIDILKGCPRPVPCVCSTCGKSFPNEGRLHAHKLFHDDRQEFKCKICGEQQLNQSFYTKHMANHKGECVLCPICHKVYRNMGSLRTHKRKIHGRLSKQQYDCTICNYKFVRKCDKVRHDNERHPVVAVAGESAGSGDVEQVEESQEANHRVVPLHGSSRNGTNPQDDITQRLTSGDENSQERPPEVIQEGKQTQPHEKLNGFHDRDDDVQMEIPVDMLGRAPEYFTRPNLFKCNYCTKVYSTTSRKKQHEEEVHEDKGRYKCPVCPKQFHDRVRYEIHWERHSSDKLYKCPHCPSSFASQNALDNHSGEHTGLKPHKCQHCGKGFGQKQHLQSHIRRLHGVIERKHICGFCGKGFAHQWDLTKHERRHRGFRPFACHICGRDFTVKHALQRHVLCVHEKVKPFECKLCNKRFSLNNHHNIHMMQHKRRGELIPS